MSGRSALLVGNGGREHALGVEIAPVVDTLWHTGENAGIEAIPNAQRVPASVDIGDFAVSNEVDLTVIGPEQPLVDGLADQIREAGLPVFGPSAEAAQLEASKHWGRAFAARHGIPVPAWDFVQTNDEYQRAKRRHSQSNGVVLKADGLAGGKGVLVLDSWDEADRYAPDMLSGKLFGAASEGGILVEERLHGPEVSMFVLTDGKNFSILPLTQDHKRRDDGDEGPNTGGTGAYTIPEGKIVAPWQYRQMEDIAERSVAGMKAEGIPYRGVLYIGLMLAEEHWGAPVVIEYNVRFGDPEAQVLTPTLGENTFDILASTDSYLRADLVAKRTGQEILSTCLMAGDYPDGKSHGVPIYGLDKDYEGVTVYHGGTARREDGHVVTNGGRILYVTGHGTSVDEAAARAKTAIGRPDGIHFQDMHYRKDIGWQVRRAA